MGAAAAVPTAQGNAAAQHIPQLHPRREGEGAEGDGFDGPLAPQGHPGAVLLEPAADQGDAAAAPHRQHGVDGGLGQPLLPGAGPDRLQQGVELPLPLIPKKIRDRKRKKAEFIAALQTRLAALRTQPALRSDFIKEMRRFLPAAVVRDTLSKQPYWSFLVQAVSDLCEKAVAAVKAPL